MNKGGLVEHDGPLHLRDRVAALGRLHAETLAGYWDPARLTFGLEGSDASKAHVTTACTCVSSFLEVPRPVLPEYLQAGLKGFSDWLLKTPWREDQAGRPNLYAIPVALTTALSLDAKAIANDQVKSAVFDLINTIDTCGGNGLSHREDYPPSGFLTYWAVRGLSLSLTAVDGIWRGDDVRRLDENLKAIVNWGQQELFRQLSFFGTRDMDRFDPLQLAYCLAITDFDGAVHGAPPDVVAIRGALDALFASQLDNGMWSKGRAIFSEPAGGSIYPFPIEVLTVLMRVGARPARPGEVTVSSEYFGPHVPGLLRVVDWIESHRLASGDTFGWRSNYLPPGGRPQAWSTAAVFAFLRNLDRLLAGVATRDLLSQFDVTTPKRFQPASVTKAGWSSLMDSQTRLGRQGSLSLKDLLYDEVVEPHRLGEPRVWSVVLFGPPGTAKTSLAKDIAAALGWPLVSLGTADFLRQGADMMAGQAQVLVRQLEQMVEAVVLIDEVEEFVRDRATTHDRESRVITTAMLSLLQRLRDRKEVLLVLTTNFVETFDRAIRRPGRIDLVALVLPPSHDAKWDAMEERLVAEGLGLASDLSRANTSVGEVVERFTFAEWQLFMRTMVARVRAAGVSELTRATFELVIKEFEPDLTIDHDEWRLWSDSKGILNV